MDLTPLSGVAAGLARSVIGWAKNSAADGKIDTFELRLLAETIIRVGLFGAVAAYLPGLSLEAVEVAAVAIGADILFNLFKKKK